MTSTPAKSYKVPPSPTSILAVAGLLLLVTLAGGGLVRFQTQQVLDGASIAARSQEAVSLINGARQSLERFEYQTHVYQADKIASRLEEARREGALTQATLERLRKLVSSGNETTSRIGDLSGAISLINQQVNQPSIPYGLLQTELVSCKQILATMAEQEQRLLDDGSQTTERASSLLLDEEAATLCLVFLVGMALVGICVLNLTAHQEAESVRAAQAATVRRQAEELKTLQASLDERQLGAVIQAIAEPLPTKVVAPSQNTSDAPVPTNLPQEPMPAAAGLMATHKILVVDDDPNICMALAVRLKFHGYSVVSATDISSALTMASAEMPDLVILDINLPDGDGFSFMDRMREIPGLDEIPVVMLSGSDLDASRENTLKTLSVTFFQKGQQNRDFLNVVQRSLQMRQSSPSSFIPA